MLEGGSILTDGAGTLLTTEQCLLHPSRNPSLTRDQIEAELRVQLGVQRIVWLGDGLVEDRDTDGHVDLIAAFTPDGGVLLQTVAPDNPNHARLRGEPGRLQAAGPGRSPSCRTCRTPRSRASGSRPAISTCTSATAP